MKNMISCLKFVKSHFSPQESIWMTDQVDADPSDVISGRVNILHWQTEYFSTIKKKHRSVSTGNAWTKQADMYRLLGCLQIDIVNISCESHMKFVVEWEKWTCL